MENEMVAVARGRSTASKSRSVEMSRDWLSRAWILSSGWTRDGSDMICAASTGLFAAAARILRWLTFLVMNMLRW